MRSRQERHLQSILRNDTTPALQMLAKTSLTAMPFETAPARLSAPQQMISPEFNGHQYAIFLLHVDAGIEHALMVQYLYAAYSMGGPHVPPEHAATVERWQETILGIAKEEMGHLITVENVLRLLSGPLNLDREDFPFDAGFYPFTFTLERLTLDSLAKYIYAEMPADWTGPLATEVKRRAEEANKGKPLHAVHELFDLMIATIADPELVPDEYFRPETVAQQASWSEWGRGYAHGARGSELQRDQPRTPDLIIRTVDSRATAVDALHAIAEQGEATTMIMRERSHFERFLRIYVEWSEILKKDKRFDPARPVVKNPVVEDSLRNHPEKISDDDCDRNVITAPLTFYWAHLLNIRYRLLLSALNHALHLSGALRSTKQPTARGDVLTLIFSEMYKIRSLAGVLVQLPVREGTPPEKASAGPPFQMPYTLAIPQGEDDRWRWHRDMLYASRKILDILFVLEPDARRKSYAAALRQADVELIEVMDRLIARENATSEKEAEVLS
ncbi:MAG TPA: ferritin-like domain-containing protein [Thermoanaerobaculia bacterium]|nr:ferritin-like domain-containing protein [Thermoanaerobaculia bacterium]